MTVTEHPQTTGGVQRNTDGFFELQRTGDPATRKALIEEHRWIAIHCARRFANRGEPMDDLVQVAMLGLVLSVDRFSPERGLQFSTFAVPTILGELRRHFRDRTWPLRVTRRVKELHLAVSAVSEQLVHQLGRPPQIEDIAEALDVSVDEVLEAMEAGNCYRTAPLEAPARNGDEDGVLDGPRLSVVDDELAGSDVRLTIREAVSELPERDRQVVYLRFYENLSQSEIAEQIGVSQVHVSRILRAVLARLEQELRDAGHDPSLEGDAMELAAG
jgi:RNA polymerase sigma-B factor